MTTDPLPPPDPSMRRAAPRPASVGPAESAAMAGEPKGPTDSSRSRLAALEQRRRPRDVRPAGRSARARGPGTATKWVAGGLAAGVSLAMVGGMAAAGQPGEPPPAQEYVRRIVVVPVPPSDVGAAPAETGPLSSVPPAAPGRSVPDDAAPVDVVPAPPPAPTLPPVPLPPPAVAPEPVTESGGS